MLRYIARRAVISVLTVFGVATIVFAVMQVIPGGAVSALAGPQAARDPETRAALERQYGLDKPLVTQYGIWVKNAVQGDFGRSITTRAPVADEIVRRVGITGELTLLATIVSIVVGIPVGVFAALRRNSPADGATRLLSLAWFSIPDFVLGSLLIYWVSTRGIGLPVSGYIPLREDVVGHFKSMALPTLSLSLITTAVVIRVIRSSVVEVLSEPYVTTARAKGLHARVVTGRHVVRTALIPTVTIIGINVGYLLSGAVLIEQIFSLPGLGRYALQGISNRDLPVIQGAVVVGATAFVLTNLLVDLVYSLVDPRIRY